MGVAEARSPLLRPGHPRLHLVPETRFLLSNLGRVPRSDQSRRIPVLWACCPGVGAVAALAGMARARDRSSLHAVRKENNGRKSWFRVSTVSLLVDPDTVDQIVAPLLDL